MAHWRPLTMDDIPSLMRVADSVHPGLPESDAVFAERVRLFPDGCLALVGPEGDQVEDQLCGYAISHPIRRRRPPELDSLLGAIVPGAEQYYIHDVAILGPFRGQGYGTEGIHRLLTVARRYPAACLISVYGTGPFWGRFGFKPEPMDQALSRKLQDYGDGAAFLSVQHDQ